MVSRVSYPPCPTTLTTRRAPDAARLVLFSFDLNGDRAAGRRRGAAPVRTWPTSARALVIHPASTTHFRMDDQGSRRQAWRRHAAAVDRPGRPCRPTPTSVRVQGRRARPWPEAAQAGRPATDSPPMLADAIAAPAYAYSGAALRPVAARRRVHPRRRARPQWGFSRATAHHGFAVPPDLPGHRRSAVPRSARSKLADWLLALPTRRRARLAVGHSTGSLVALEGLRARRSGSNASHGRRRLPDEGLDALPEGARDDEPSARHDRLWSHRRSTRAPAPPARASRSSCRTAD